MSILSGYIDILLQSRALLVLLLVESFELVLRGLKKAGVLPSSIQQDLVIPDLDEPASCLKDNGTCKTW